MDDRLEAWTACAWMLLILQGEAVCRLRCSGSECDRRKVLSCLRELISSGSLPHTIHRLRPTLNKQVCRWNDWQLIANQQLCLFCGQQQNVHIHYGNPGQPVATCFSLPRISLENVQVPATAAMQVYRCLECPITLDVVVT